MSNFSDNFNRANGDIGAPWSILAGDFEVSSNACIEVSGNSNSAAVQDAGTTEGYCELTITQYGSGAGWRMILRATDASNYIYAEIDQGGFAGIWKREAGSNSTLDFSDSFSPSAGDTYKFEVSGNTYTLTRNGAGINCTTTSSFNSSATKHGIGRTGAGSYIIDNFSFTDTAAGGGVTVTPTPATLTLTTFAPTVSVSGGYNVVVLGDSIQFGTGASGAPARYPARLQAHLGTGNYVVTSAATSGRQLDLASGDDLRTDVAGTSSSGPDLPDLFNGSAADNILIVGGGTNDMGDSAGNVDGATASTRRTSVVTDAIAGGWTVIELTLGPANYGASFETRRQAFNAARRAAFIDDGAVGLVDFGADEVYAGVGDEDDTTYYTDGIHETDVTQDAKAAMTAAIILQYVAGLEPGAGGGGGGGQVIRGSPWIMG